VIIWSDTEAAANKDMLGSESKVPDWLVRPLQELAALTALGMIYTYGMAYYFAGSVDFIGGLRAIPSLLMYFIPLVVLFHGILWLVSKVRASPEPQ
jgi:hypothetical protein